jgi:hypothetical protein
MRAAVVAEAGSSAAGRAQLDLIIPIIQQACTEDRWPAPVLACITNAKSGDLAAFQACSNQLPQDLQARMAKRLTAVMVDLADAQSAK